MSLRNTKLTTIDRIFTRLRGSMPLDNESDIIEDIGDALEAIGAITQYRPAVQFAEVKNFRCKVPKDSKAIIQLARNRVYSGSMHVSTFQPVDAIQHLGAQIRKPISLTDYAEAEGDQCDCILELGNEYDFSRYEPIFSTIMEYGTWINSKIYREAFTPIRLTNHSFFNTSVCKEDNYEEIYSNCTDEYDIIDGEILRFSFKEGQVGIAYHQIQMGPDGYPMIPDDISYVTAIANYCLWKHYTREFYSGREGAQSKMQLAESEWIWYCGQSKNKALMITGEDEHQNFLDQRSYMIPPRGKYFGFFGGLNKGEKRRF